MRIEASPAAITCPVPTWLLWSVLALVFAPAVAVVAVQLPLLGDGSFYLLRAIGEGQSNLLPGREAANAIRLYPLVAAVDLGVTNLAILSTLFGTTAVLIPVGVWGLALIVARDDGLRFAIVAIMASATLGLTMAMAVSELFFGLPFAALVTTLLSQSKPLDFTRGAIAVAACSP